MADHTKANRTGAPVRVGVISADIALERKIELALSGIAEVRSATYGSEGGFDLILADRRTRHWALIAPSLGEAGLSTAENISGGKAGLLDAKDAVDRTVNIVDRAEWREGESTLPYPFAFRELRELVTDSGASAARLIIEGDGRHILLDGKKIRLTEREHALISAIAEGKGEFVGREELRARAFGEYADGGILNVYVHYLREKLEGGGEKIILSSRLGGYKIDGKYLGVEK